MASGGPGDHWLTDVVNERPAFGEPLDSMIRDVHRLGGHHQLDDQADLGRHLSRAWSSGDDHAPLTRELRRLRDSLRKQAIANGWEVE